MCRSVAHESSSIWSSSSSWRRSSLVIRSTQTLRSFCRASTVRAASRCSREANGVSDTMARKRASSAESTKCANCSSRMRNSSRAARTSAAPSTRRRSIDALPTIAHDHVPGVGLEPTRPFGQWILNPPRLPFRHPGWVGTSNRTDFSTGCVLRCPHFFRFRFAHNKPTNIQPGLGRSDVPSIQRQQESRRKMKPSLRKAGPIHQ